MRLLFRLFLMFVPLSALGQMTLTVTPPQYYMPILENIYIAGDFNEWNPAGEDWLLTPLENGSYSIQLNEDVGANFNFKFTRGDWGRVEATESGAYIPDREAGYVDGQTLNLSIAGWEDFPGASTATGNTQVLSTLFDIPQLNRTRRVWVYLPPGYDENTDLYYPVLYMHDAQNLFDAASSFAGEWQVDESMESLPDDCYPGIVVGIDNGGAQRIDEYSAWVNQQYGGGEAAAFSLFIKDTLKPFIDSYFRTFQGPQHTAVAGSSLGGLLAMYMVLEHGDTFGRAGVLSPSFWFSDGVFALAESHPAFVENRIFMLGGTNESDDMVPDMQQMRDILLGRGYAPEHIRLEAHSYGQHNEAYWAGEYQEVFKWLFADLDLSLPAPPSTRQGEIFYPNPTKGVLHLQAPLNGHGHLRVFDLTGRMRLEANIASHQRTIELSGLPAGVYLLNLQSSDGNSFSKTIILEP